MASVVDVCNRALQKLGAERITSLTQNSVSARACNLAYELVRDAELRSHTWNFSIKRASLAEDAAAPEYGFDNQFTLPSDCLRLLPNDYQEGAYTSDWKVEGRKILTNDSAPLYVRYISRVTDTTQYDALFIEALACKMAMEMCEELTQSNAKRELSHKEYINTMRDARRMNAFENNPAEQQTDGWVTSRI